MQTERTIENVKLIRTAGAVGVVVLGLVLAGCKGVAAKGEKEVRQQVADVTKTYRPKGQKPPLPTLTTNSTLGEHIFLQLKGARTAERASLKIYSRTNAERAAHTKKRGEVAQEIEVLPFSLEARELVTVQRMSAALPVLLVRADLKTRRCYFVCLNDYIDKILIPRRGDYRTKATTTIHVPSSNDLADPQIGIAALRWYSKRAKLLAAFQKFIYQQVELSYAVDRRELTRLAKHFASLLVKYDFWEDTPMWEAIGHYGTALRRFLAGGSPILDSFTKAPAARSSPAGNEIWRRTSTDVVEEGIRVLWGGLGALPRLYEEICREWFLPTSLGLLASYPRTNNVSPSTATPDRSRKAADSPGERRGSALGKPT